ncbi:MAG: hypothetical protein ACFCU3_11710 [Verrucomicrobiales bacterium]
MKLKLHLLALIVLNLASVSWVFAEEPLAIGLNFVSDDEDSRLGAETRAGAVPHPNWNDVSQKGADEAQGFVNSRGEDISLKIEWRHHRNRRRGGSTPLEGEADPNQKLFVATVSTPITFTNIPPEFAENGYSVIVYFLPYEANERPLKIIVGLPAEDGMRQEELDARWAFTMKKEDLSKMKRDPLVRTDGYSFGDGEPGGNYVVFEGLNEQHLVIGASRWINEGTVSGGTICAIQFVAD